MAKRYDKSRVQYKAEVLKQHSSEKGGGCTLHAKPSVLCQDFAQTKEALKQGIGEGVSYWPYSGKMLLDMLAVSCRTLSYTSRTNRKQP